MLHLKNATNNQTQHQNKTLAAQREDNLAQPLSFMKQKNEQSVTNTDSTHESLLQLRAAASRALGLRRRTCRSFRRPAGTRWGGTGRC